MELSPLWTVLLLAIVLGPIAAALVQGIRHRESGAPKHDDTLEAQAMLQVMKDTNDMRTGGRGFS
jgi:hypothetical protein